MKIIKKKGQITFFLLIGIILIAFSFLFYIRSLKVKDAEIKKASELPLNGPAIKSFIESCLKIVSTNGIYFLSSRGGYYDLPDNYFRPKPATAFYIYNNKDISPELSNIENELSKYIQNQINFCVNYLDLKGRTISFEERKAKSILNNESIFVSLHMPTVISDNNSNIEFEDYQAEIINNKLFTSFHVAKNIANQIANNPKNLCVTCIFKLADKNNLDVFIDSYNEYTHSFQLIDKVDRLYVFNFAINLKSENES